MKQNLALVVIICAILGMLTLYKRTCPPTLNERNTMRKSIIVGTSADYPPFSFFENRTIVGFDIDVVKEVGKRLGKHIVIHNLEFDALIPEIQLGTVDIIAAGITATPERAQRVFFSKPYLEGVPLLVITRTDKPLIKKFEDLHEKHIVVNEGYTADAYMSDKKGFTLDRLPSVSDAFLALNSGHADAFVSAKHTIKPFLKHYEPNTFSFFTIKDFDENNALALSKHRPDLVPLVQNALDEMQKDGTLEELKKKWDLL
jgi:ABC-type amino acid transport substrate-binding protein